MAAFSLTLAIFAMWSLVGWALVCLLNGRRNLIRNALLAPVTGASVVMLAIFECSRWGAPVGACGAPVTVLCLVLAVVLIWRRRLYAPAKPLTPFVAVIAAGALLVGYPMLLHGFNWLSYSNDDMANYVLGAQGFLERGYLNWFDPRLILETRDMALARWLPVTLTGIRCGCELLLAWVMSLTGLSGHQVFMPVIVAFHLSLICSAGALVVRGRQTRLAGLVTCAWMAVCSLVALGTVYQLIAQVFGLALLAGAGSLLLQPARREPLRIVVKRGALIAVFCAALGVAYPETLPFLILAFGLQHCLLLLRRRETLSSLACKVAVVLAGTILLLNNFADAVPNFLLNQAQIGLREIGSNVLFPFYLVPSGLATFWGFLPIAQPMGRPLIDLAIAAGAMLLVVAGAAVLWQVWRGQPSAAFAAVMLVLAVRLASLPSDFGLYKLAMFIQPFLLGSLVVAWFSWRKSMSVTARVLPIAVLAALGLGAELHYVRLSAERGGGGGGFVEIPRASSLHLVSQLQNLGRTPHSPLVVSDTSNVVLAKLEAIYLAPSSQQYPTQDFFAIHTWRLMPLTNWSADLIRPGYVLQSRETVERWYKMQRDENFDMRGGSPNPFTRIAGRDGDTGYSLLASGPYLSVVNRRQPRVRGSIVAMVASQELHNYLLQVDSELGKNYYAKGNARAEGRVATFQLEPDYFYPGSFMSGVGRVILYEVLHPSPRVRLEMEFSASVLSDGRNAIPPVQAIGAQRLSFGALGRGSARLFSPPLETQTIDGRHYVAVDMGAPGRLFPQQRSGLMRWFGAAIPLDSRRITGFLRDVSALDEQEYVNFRAPGEVANFPADLGRKELEYSGIYEDGWVAEDSFVQLRQPPEGSQLTVRAMVPALPPRATSLRVFADGNPVANAPLRAGDNEVQVPLEGPAARRRIELRFDSVTALPAPDGRLVSAQLKFVGFRENTAGLTEISTRPIGIGDHWYPFEKFAGQTFRWVENDARFAINLSNRELGELAIDVEPGPGMAGKPLTLNLLLQSGGTRVLPTVTGRKTIRIPLLLAGGMNKLSLHCEGGGRTIPSDPRKLNFRVFALTWTALSRAR